MRHFRFLRGRARGDATSRPATEAREWAHAGVADEVEAYLAGRYVELMVARKRPVPAWAVVNRLAHATRDELGRVVQGTTMSRGSPPSRRVAWEESERFLAGSLLARTRGTDDLAALQLTSLVPLELALIQAGRAERMDAEQVLAASAEALDGSLLG